MYIIIIIRCFEPPPLSYENGTLEKYSIIIIIIEILAASVTIPRGAWNTAISIYLYNSWGGQRVPHTAQSEQDTILHKDWTTYFAGLSIQVKIMH